MFSNLRGRHLDPTMLRRRVLDPAMKAAGIEGKHGFHLLRHTCASQLLAAGVRPLVVSRILGHHSAAFTLDVYGHLLPDDPPDLDALAARGAR